MRFITARNILFVLYRYEIISRTLVFIIILHLISYYSHVFVYFFCNYKDFCDISYFSLAPCSYLFVVTKIKSICSCALKLFRVKNLYEPLSIRIFIDRTEDALRNSCKVSFVRPFLNFDTKE